MRTVLLLIFGMLLSTSVHSITLEQAEQEISRSWELINEVKEEGFPHQAMLKEMNASLAILERAQFSELIMGNASGPLADQAAQVLESLPQSDFSYDAILQHTQN